MGRRFILILAAFAAFFVVTVALAAPASPVSVTPNPPVAGQPAVWSWDSDKGDQVHIAINCDDGGQYGGMLKSEVDEWYVYTDLEVIYPNVTHCRYSVWVVTYTGTSGNYHSSFVNGEFDVVAP